MINMNILAVVTPPSISHIPYSDGDLDPPALHEVDEDTVK